MGLTCCVWVAQKGELFFQVCGENLFIVISLICDGSTRLG